ARPGRPSGPAAGAPARRGEADRSHRGPVREIRRPAGVGRYRRAGAGTIPRAEEGPPCYRDEAGLPHSRREGAPPRGPAEVDRLRAGLVVCPCSASLLTGRPAAMSQGRLESVTLA